MLYSSTRCFFLLGVLGLVAIVQVHAQNLEDIVKEFEALNPNIVNTLTQNQTCAAHTEALWKTLNALRNEAQKLAGDPSFQIRGAPYLRLSVLGSIAHPIAPLLQVCDTSSKLGEMVTLMRWVEI